MITIKTIEQLFKRYQAVEGWMKTFVEEKEQLRDAIKEEMAKQETDTLQVGAVTAKRYEQTRTTYPAKLLKAYVKPEILQMAEKTTTIEMLKITVAKD